MMEWTIFLPKEGRIASSVRKEATGVVVNKVGKGDKIASNEMKIGLV